MYGGDEVNAIVLDLGAGSVKAGYAGEDTPKAVFPSVVGCRQGEPAADGKPPTRERFVGSQALGFRRDNLEVVPALKDGLYDDWEIVEDLWSHAFSDRLRVDPKEHPLMLAEPSFQPREARERVVSRIFEGSSAPALFLAKNAALSSYATGRQTSLVVDMGHEGTVVAAVHDGYVLHKSVACAPLGGALLTRCMLQSVESKGVEVAPPFSFRRKEKAPGQFEVVRLDLPGTTDSYRRWSVETVAADIKEAICRVSDSAFNAEENANIPTVTYELPDGTEIQVGPDRFKVPEVLFQPSILTTFPGLPPVRSYDNTELKSLPGLVQESIGKCDMDIRRDMYNGVILTGGMALFTGVRDRLERELVEVAPQVAKVKVTSPMNTIERRYSVWIGGSILASLGSFQQMWMSKSEYEEHGAALIHRKAP